MTSIPDISVDYFINPAYKRTQLYSAQQAKILNQQSLEQASAEIKTWEGYAVTPLESLQELANTLGVQSVHYKQEASRFGLGSFKALGGAYAVGRLLCREVGIKLGREITMNDLRQDADVREVCATVTVVTATDGNHGRSVAWGAHLFGCQSVIYLHENVSEGREKAIQDFGASIVRTPGHYDDSVRQADLDAKKNGWFLISDTSYPGYTDIPRDVMQGYQIMVEEAVTALPAPVTHVFVQGGVGALPAAVCAYFWEHQGADRPVFIVAEPQNADCLFQSAVAGEIRSAKGDLNTVMAGLACGEVSLLAWEILAQGTDAFCVLDDSAAIAAMKLLAYPLGDDPVIVAGESAVAGLAAAIGVVQNAKARMDIGLDSQSRLLFFGSEGSTDPAVYLQLVGATPEQVLAGIKL